jgi:hypothetical protein
MSARKLASFASLLFAATVGVSLGACGPHSDYRINKVCKRYCDRWHDCNDTVDFDNCVDDCIDAAMDCDSDSDVEAALDILDECVGDSCNHVGTCLVEAALECTL